MKNRFLIALMAIPALIVPFADLAAQGFTGYAAPQLLTGGTNFVAAATTNSYSSALTLTRQREVGIQISFASVGTNSSTIKFNFYPSLDNATIDRANTDYVLSIPANGTNTVTFVTNQVVGAIGYLSFDSIENPNATKALTNVAVNYSIKR